MASLEAARESMRAMMGDAGRSAPQGIVDQMLRHTLRDEQSTLTARQFWRLYGQIWMATLASQEAGARPAAGLDSIRAHRDFVARVERGDATLREVADYFLARGFAPPEVRLIPLMQVRDELLHELGVS